MQREYCSSNHHVNSVSDLYISDEISVLLEEIQSLEPSSYRPEDIQDFEIAGSQTGGTGGGGRAASSIAELETPGDATTVHSWDSHANYKHHIHGSSPTQSVFSGVIVYCDDSYIKSTSGVIRLLLVITSLICLLCLCTSGSVRLSLFLLPFLGRIRFMMFVSIFSFMVTCVLLFLDVTHIIYLFPLNWGKINAVLYVSISVLYLMSSSLVVHQVYAYEESYSWVPKATRTQLFVTGVIGYLCALEALLLALLTRCDEGQYRPVNDDPSSITLQERKVIRYSPSPCPSLQPAVVTPHWVSQDNNFPSSSSKTRDPVLA
ncbi:uncharacterized protein LOC135846080 isoform X2 [Planococcus citri]|uniref:uncharacterized protein LOC135846080 isoform X2 n=1 Tax=Planococcus citri TaxID=170843 RepID=UPI0031F99509